MQSKYIALQESMDKVLLIANLLSPAFIFYGGFSNAGERIFIRKVMEASNEYEKI